MTAYCSILFTLLRDLSSTLAAITAQVEILILQNTPACPVAD